MSFLSLEIQVLDPIQVLEIQHDDNLELAETVKEYLPLLVTMSFLGRSMRYLPGSGLGRHHQGIVEPIHVQAIELGWGRDRHIAGMVDKERKVRSKGNSVSKC